jgi:hypothetical protein
MTTPIVIGSGVTVPESGELKTMTILQKGAPVRVLDGWKDVTFEATWSLSPGAQGHAFLTGADWKIQLFAESMGAGFEGLLHEGTVTVASAVVNVANKTYDYTYQGTVVAPPAVEHGPEDSAPTQPRRAGVYKLVGTLFLNGKDLVEDMVAFDELQMIMNEPIA